MFLFFEPSLIQKKVLEGLYRLGDAFNENKILELHNLKILKSQKENKNPELSNSKIFYLIKLSYLTWFFILIFLVIKFPSYEKLPLTSKFDSGFPDPE